MGDKIAKVSLNGQTLIDISEDSVTPEVLAEDETAHDAAGEQIRGTAQFGGDTTDCYKITDPASTDIADNDYIPFNDVFDSETPKKKTLFSNIKEKLKSLFSWFQSANSGNTMVWNAKVGNFIAQIKVDKSVNKMSFNWSSDNGETWHGNVALQNALTFDNRPKANSDNPVKSSGLYNTISTLLGEAIPADSDLDDYLAEGVYYISTQAKAQSCSHCPIGLSGKLIVMNLTNTYETVSTQTQGDWSTQFYITNHENHIYKRIRTNTAWGDWVEIVNDKSSALITNAGTEIPVNSDLNNYTTGGNFYIVDNATAATISNIPSVTSGKLLVLDPDTGTRVTQIYITNKDNVRMYIRACDNNLAWEAWKEFTTTGNISDILQDKTQYLDGAVATDHKIYPTDDLDDFTDAGTYQYVYNSGGVPANCPLSVIRSFKLIVDRYNEDSRSEICQRITMVNTSSSEHWLDWYRFRSWNASTWGDWMQVASNYDLNQSVAHTGKNLLPQMAAHYGQIYGASVTSNGITWTLNEDGSIGANGTATADSTFYLATNAYGYMLPKGSYVLTGCPSGGASNKYFIKLQIKLDGGNEVSYMDTGNGISFTLTADARNSSTSNYYIHIESGQTVSNIVFKPMVRHAYTDATYEKYIPNGQDVKGVVYVGTCTTAANQQNKVANVDSDFRLKKGVRIAIKFTNTNTFSSSTNNPVTLNVNNTGAKNIWYNTTHSGAGNTGTNSTIYGYANKYIYYVYDGTYWVWDGHSVDANSTNFLPNNSVATLTMTVTQLSGKSSEIDAQAADNGVSTTRYPTVNELLDKNNLIIGRDELVVQSNGKIRKFWYVRNYNGSTSAVGQKGIAIEMDKTGDVVWYVHDPQYFNAAIGEGYGTCSTAADQRIKVVDCNKFVLCKGAVIHVKFTNTNTYNSTTENPVQLNVNGTGAKNIWYNAAHSGSGNTGTSTRIYGEANRIFTYMYDGTYWVWLGCGYEADTQDPRYFGIGFGTCDTAAATAAKVVTYSNYVLRTGGYVTVKFTYDVPANATMNINSRGAKSIYYRGAAITAGKIKAGDRVTFVYNGTQYDLVSNDRWGGDKTNYIKKTDIVWSDTLTASATVTNGYAAAYKLNDNMLWVSLESSYNATSAVTIPAYNHSSTNVFCRINGNFNGLPGDGATYSHCGAYVDIKETLYPCFVSFGTINNNKCMVIALRKKASIAAGTGNIRITFTIPCEIS